VIEALELLTEARDRIEQYGWRRGAYGSKETGYCLLGALGWAEDVSLTMGAMAHAERALAAAIDQHYYRDYDAVATVLGYNDNRCYTKAEAVATLERAIKLCNESERERQGANLPGEPSPPETGE
jgi:hypothetical protein